MSIARLGRRFTGRDPGLRRPGIARAGAKSSRVRYDQPMRSKLAEQSELDLIRLNQRLTPTQRLEAFLAQCRLMATLRKAGDDVRPRAADSRDAAGNPQ
jgi:hypothetical protein